MHKIFLAYFVLIAAGFFTHIGVLQNDFLNYDDPEIITENPNVNNGLSWQGFNWAFSTILTNSSMPVTWLSHMMDCSLFGLNPKYHHLMSLIFHVLNVLLLFNFLNYATREIWPSFVAAIIFAVHPVNVETIAWVATRNHLLSIFFCLLNLNAYARYVKSNKNVFYFISILFFEMALLSKTVVIVLPFLLLGLDYWPFRRFDNKRKFYCLIKEKIPFFILSFISGVILIYLYYQAGRIWSLENLSIAKRLSNLLIVYSMYLGKIFWPTNLAVLYPYPINWLPVWKYFFAFIVLAGISILVIRNAKNRPYIVTGWIWFLLILLPLSGLVQIGFQLIGDRYLYFPAIAIFITISWCGFDLIQKNIISQKFVSLVILFIVTCLCLCSHIQGKYWKNSITLYEHTLAITENNFFIHQNYGGALVEQNRIDEAIVQFKQVLQIKPSHYKAAYSLGRLYMRQKQYDLAEKYLRKVLDINSYHSWANYRLGIILLEKGSYDKALKYLGQALKINPYRTDAHFAIAKIYYLSSKFDLVIDYCNQNLIYFGDSVPLRLLFSRTLAEQNRYVDAVTQYFHAFKLEPDRVYTLKSIALILATVDDDKIYDPAAAVRLAERACELTNYNDSKALAILAVACSNKADFERAQKMVQKAIDISKPLNQQQLSNELQKQLLLYKNNQPFRQKTEILKPDLMEIES